VVTKDPQDVYLFLVAGEADRLACLAAQQHFGSRFVGVRSLLDADEDKVRDLVTGYTVPVSVFSTPELNEAVSGLFMFRDSGQKLYAFAYEQPPEATLEIEPVYVKAWLTETAATIAQTVADPNVPLKDRGWTQTRFPPKDESVVHTAVPYATMRWQELFALNVATYLRQRHLLIDPEFLGFLKALSFEHDERDAARLWQERQEALQATDDPLLNQIRKVVRESLLKAASEPHVRTPQDLAVVAASPLARAVYDVVIAGDPVTRVFDRLKVPNEGALRRVLFKVSLNLDNDELYGDYLITQMLSENVRTETIAPWVKIDPVEQTYTLTKQGVRLFGALAELED
jgi:hypothetical protein